MRRLSLFFILAIGLALVTQGCREDEKNKTLSPKVNQTEKPIVRAVVRDSLIIRTPGDSNTLLPAMQPIVAVDWVPFGGKREYIPGKSYLPQTDEQQKAGESPVKSKKPTRIRVNNKNLTSQPFSEPSKKTNVAQPVFVNADSLSTIIHYFKNNGLFSIQNGDTIYPPVTVLSTPPEPTTALSFKYQDDASYDISFLDADQQLPNSFIRDIVADDQSVLWFGTHTGGLISYDGAYFRQYTQPNGLTTDMVLDLLLDSKGRILVGTQGGGLNIYDGHNITQLTTKQGLPSNNVTSVIEDKNGNYWMGTTRGVVRFDGSEIVTYTTEQGLTSNYVSTLFEDNEGNIWLGTDSGLNKFDGEGFIHYTTEIGLTHNHIFSIMQDHYGNLWIGTYGGGVSMFDGKFFTNYTKDQGFDGDVVLSIIEDQKGQLWFGTFGHGVIRFNGKAFKQYTTKDGLNDDYIRSLFEDKNGNIWIGTYGNGVCLLKTNSFNHLTQDQNLPNDLVLSISQDNKNRLWFGTFEGGIVVYNESQMPEKESEFVHITREEGLTNNIVSDIMQDNSGNFWIATYGGGVSHINGEKFNNGIIEIANYGINQGLTNEIVRSVIQDTQGNIWFATEGGATRYNGKTMETFTTKTGLASNIIVTLFSDSQGAVWMGTLEGGVSRYLNDTITNYTSAQGLSGEIVWTIAEDSNNMMWFGTDGGGISCFDGKEFTTINTNNGLVNNYVFSLVIDNQANVWVGTIRGLSKISISPAVTGQASCLDSLNIINFGKLDGLKGLDFYTNAAFLDNKNRIWWGTQNALTMLDLNKHEIATNNISIRINSISINDIDINYRQLKLNEQVYGDKRIFFDKVTPFTNEPIGLSIPYDQNHLTFRFSGTDFGATHQVLFQFKLAGLENQWNALSTDKYADYRNISPGRYVFMLRAKNKAGQWSNTLSFPFIVRHPWWQMWYAFAGYLLLLTLMVWLLIKWRVNILQKQKHALEKMVSERTKELHEALILAEQATVAKSQFIATISHEIRTPLNAIMGLTHLTLCTPLSEKQNDFLQKINRSAVTLLGLINDVLDFSKIEAGKMSIEHTAFDLEIVLNSVMISNQQTAAEKNLEFIIHVAPEMPSLLVGDPLRISQVITNLCNNALKFTNTGGVVLKIEKGKQISADEFFLICTVSDTGIGIKKEQMAGLFDAFNQADNTITRQYGGTGLGLSICKLISEMMEGEIQVQSEFGQGSTFTFTGKLKSQPETLDIFEMPDELKQLEIMICSGSQATVAALTDHLVPFNFMITTTTSGEEALSMLENSSIELLIVDMKLPDMSGLDVIFTHRQNKGSSKLKTILIAESEQGKTNLEQNIKGISAFLSKPFLPGVVREKILIAFGMNDSRIRKQPQVQKTHDIYDKLLGSRVLLAEDNEINREVVVELLGNIGIQTQIADNGEMACRLAREMSFDLILMDLHMPVLDGFQATIQIRKEGNNTPVLAITAEALEGVQKKCRETGINGLISKPIDPADFYRQVSQWIVPKSSTHEINQQIDPQYDTEFSSFTMDELDWKSGINRFGKNRELYLKMLAKFVSSNKHTCSRIRDLLLENDLKQAHLKIHSIKGEAGNLGLNRVMKMALEVEDSILEDNETAFKLAMVVLEQELEQVFEKLTAYFKMNPPAKASTRSRQEIVEDLIKNLEARNPEALNLLDELEQSGILPSEISRVNVAVANGEMPLAFELLRKMAAKDQ